MNNSYLTAGASLGNLFRLLHRNHRNISASSLPRILFLAQSAIWSTVFSTIEHLRYSGRIKSWNYPGDPLFIVGHWRTGSTYLHQLLSLHPALHAPTLLQVAIPNGFIVGEPFYKPVFKTLLSDHRPMDNVKMGMNEPQEEEYAWLRLLRGSPLEKVVFPEHSSFFLNNAVSFGPEGRSAAEWETVIKGWFRKLSGFSGKRIISKNPFNSFRIFWLKSIFPEARFIHIVRHPYKVIPSSIHMWTIISRQNSLSGRTMEPSIEEISRFYNLTLRKTEEESAHLSKDEMITIRFEDLLRQPLNVLSDLCEQVKLPVSDLFTAQVLRYSSGLSKYQNNSYFLTNEDKQLINRHLSWFMEKMDYHQEY